MIARAWASCFVVWLVLAAVLAGCSTPTQSAEVRTRATQSREAQPSTREALAPEAVRFAEIVATLAEASMDGRGAGYPGRQRARDYLVEQFTAAGLEPAFEIDGRRRYTQPFEVDLGARAAEQALSFATLGADGGVTALTPGRQEDFNALGLSASGAFSGKAVFVGYAIDAPEHGYSSLGDAAGGDAEGGEDDQPLRGRVAIAFRYEPMDADGRSLWAGEAGGRGRWTRHAEMRSKAAWAAARGAEALLLVDPPAMDRGGPLRGTAETVFGEPASIPVLHARGTAVRRMLQASGRHAGEALRGYRDRADRGVGGADELAVVVRGRVKIERPRTTLDNVAGWLRGTGDLADELVVVGAHYDHLGYGEIGSLAEGERALHPGADDNASGVAAVLLVAERLAGGSDTDGVTRDAPPLGGDGERTEDTAGRGSDGDAPATDRRGVLFIAFDGEERGLLGSRHLLDHPGQTVAPLEQAVAMVNFDMVGRLRGDGLYVFGTDSGEGWARLLQEANAKLARPLELNTGGSALGASDHTNFYVAGVPAVHLFTGVHEDYHRPSDTAEKINAAGGARIAELAAGTVRRLATGPRLGYRADGEPGRHAVRLQRDGPYLGILPDYSTLDGSDGAAVASVLPSTPAERAGLRGGDVLVAWDGEPIANVRDLTRRLADADGGQTVRLTVRRGERRIELDVTLGRR